jgi:unsaturated rhamnogalacturonyl hydrolase
MKKLFIVSALAAVGIVPLTVSAQTVTLDYYFNHETHKNAAGQDERFHYIWEETDLNGYSNWGDAFVKAGGTLKSLDAAPTAANLKGTDIYIIVDPDSKKETPNPHYIEAKDIDVIDKYVKDGGVLVMMTNDSANADLPHINKLAARFGMHFNDDLHNHVTNNVQTGTLMVSESPLFKTARKIYMKDISTISITPPATALLKDGDAVIIATAKYGKGTVFAVGDPWLYNEYTNGHLPANGHYDNDKATNDVAQWLLSQVPKK